MDVLKVVLKIFGFLVFPMAVAFPSSASGVPVRWIVAHQPTNKGYTQLLNDFAANLEKGSGGKLKVEFLFTENQDSARSISLNAVQAGVAQITQIPASTFAYSRQIPEFEILELPFFLTIKSDFRKIVAGDSGERLLHLIQERVPGVRGLAFSIEGNRKLFSEKKLDTLGALKGAKSFAENGIRKRFLSDAGVNFIERPITNRELEHAVYENGEVDFMENDLGRMRTLFEDFPKVLKRTKYVTELDYVPFSTVILVAGKFFDSLSKDLQKILVRELSDLAEKQSRLSETQEKEAAKILEKSGAEIISFAAKDKVKLEQVSAEFQKEYQAKFKIEFDMAKRDLAKGK